MHQLTEAAQQRRGFLTIGALAVLTIVEFLAAGLPYALPALAAIALIKAAVIAQYFMHFSELTAKEE